MLANSLEHLDGRQVGDFDFTPGDTPSSEYYAESEYHIWNDWKRRFHGLKKNI